jgi:threonine dehydratase
MDTWPIRFDDVLDAERRIRPFLAPTSLQNHPVLDATVGNGITVWVKHENHHPTGSFKVRNALSVVTRLSAGERGRGIVAATRGNHGMALAWAGRTLGVHVTVCVPHGNNPDKNEAIRALGAELVVEGRDYDECLGVADRIVAQRGARLVHSTNDLDVIAGAGTLGLEIVRERPSLDALVISVGGGSQAVGALTVARALLPSLRVYGVQAVGASAIHDSWHRGEEVRHDAARTFADGLATRQPYAFTLPALRAGLAGFVAVPDSDISLAVRMLLSTTHNLVEGAGAAGLAGLLALGDELAGKQVGIILSGANIDEDTLLRVLQGAIA